MSQPPLPRLAWDVVMRRCLSEALLEANGLSPAPVVLPEPEPTSRTQLHNYLIDRASARNVFAFVENH